jgi:hypothetical protein
MGEMSEEQARNTCAVVVRGTSAIAAKVHEGEPWSADMARVVLCGPDTVYFSFDTEVSDETWAHLQVEQEKAREVQYDAKTAHAPDWLGAVVAPTGARGGYHFRIEHADFTIKLLKGVPHRPAIFVEMRSFALHTHPDGALEACDEACRYLRDVLLVDQDDATREHITVDEARCSRLDVQCDWQGGWYPTLHEGEDRLFIRPGRCDWHPYLSGNRCTGYRFGRGKVQARIYNKTLDVKQKHLDWYPKLLQVCNGLAYNPDLPVWRLEFQLLRDGIKGFRLYAKPEVTDPDEVIEAELDKEDLPHIGSVRKALHWAGRLWEYLTRRWLRLVLADEDSNRARWPVHPTWQMLQGGFGKAMAGGPLDEGKAQLVRKERHSGYERFGHRVEVGVLTMMDAKDCAPAAAAHAWMTHLAHCLELAKLREEGLLTLGVEAERVLKGMGVMGGTTYQRYLLKGALDELLGLFTSTGVARLGMRDVPDVATLLCEFIDDLERLAAEKGGLGRLLIGKRAKLFKMRGRRFFGEAWQHGTMESNLGIIDDAA